MHIGCAKGTSADERSFTGVLCRVRLDNGALDAAQVKSRIVADLSAAARATGDEQPSPDHNWHQYFVAFHATEALPSLARLEQLQADLKEHRQRIPTAMVMKDRVERRPTYRLRRGQYDLPDKSEELLPDVPSFLPPLLADVPRNRLSLAQWLIDQENPLVARVIVNRMWQRFFGVGLVKSSENFGTQAEPPSHPLLLDWLASELVRSGWDLKALQKLIVMSATYQQSSSASSELIGAIQKIGCWREVRVSAYRRN